jgi:hypothetical protein
MPCQTGGGAVEDGPHQRQRGAFVGEATDDLHASAGFAKGALNEVGVADARPVGRTCRCTAARSRRAGNRPHLGTGTAGVSSNSCTRRSASATAPSSGSRSSGTTKISQKLTLTASWSTSATLRPRCVSSGPDSGCQALLPQLTSSVVVPGSRVRHRPAMQPVGSDTVVAVAWVSHRGTQFFRKL